MRNMSQVEAWNMFYTNVIEAADMLCTGFNYKVLLIIVTMHLL